MVKLWNLDPTYVSWVQKTWLLTYNCELCTTYNLTPNLHSETKKTYDLHFTQKLDFQNNLQLTKKLTLKLKDLLYISLTPPTAAAKSWLQNM